MPPVGFAGILVNSDEAYLPGARAGPVWESGDGAVNLDRIIKNSMRD